VSNRDAADNLEIYAANADGSSVTRLTNNPFNDTEPAIQPLASAAALGTVALSAATYTVSEGQPTLNIMVTRTAARARLPSRSRPFPAPPPSAPTTRQSSALCASPLARRAGR
jgi:hypothetical protein